MHQNDTPQPIRSLHTIGAVLILATLLLASCGVAYQPASQSDVAPATHEDGNTAALDDEATEEPAAEESDAGTGEGADSGNTDKVWEELEEALEEAADTPADGDDTSASDASEYGSTSPAPLPSSPPARAEAIDEAEEMPGADDEAEEMPGAEFAPESPDSPTIPEERPRQQGQPNPLKAGEIDDNEQFRDYLDYLASYQGPPAHTVDVSERYIISIHDTHQRPLVDAFVSIYDGQQQVFEGRTYADGRTLFLPRALNVSDNATEFHIVAERGNVVVESSFQRGERERIEIGMDGPSTRPPDTLNLDILFLLDTTGSMEDELTRIQDTIDTIAERIDTLEPRPNLRFGLVAYRDHGDEYVSRSYDFTPDVGAFRKILNTFSAAGGGDTPEALNEALHDAVQDVQWSSDAVRLIFLVADAPPHIDYEQEYDYINETQQAVARGIKIYPIAASNTDTQAEYVFRQMAQQTMARFIFLTYQPGESSGVPGEHRDDLEAGEEQQYTVERLDDLIVNVVRGELAAAAGMQ